MNSHLNEPSFLLLFDFHLSTLYPLKRGQYRPEEPVLRLQPDLNVRGWKKGWKVVVWYWSSDGGV